MYQIKKDEVHSLLQKLRQIRQASGEAISMLEHMMQLQSSNREFECYDPDDYLEQWLCPNTVITPPKSEE